MQASGQKDDPYGTFHLQLNAEPGEQGSPKTEWLNMGYWKDTNIFPKACEALALRLAKAASPKPQGRVLEAGYGCGDFILLQLSHPEIPRPSVLCGVTSLPVHCSRAQGRVERLLQTDPHLASQVMIELLQGDAVCRQGYQGHPLSENSSRIFDTILALDCAYHFKTRRDFLQQSFAHLAPGGRIGLADICFDSQLSSLATFMLSSLLSAVPRENILSEEAYVRQMIALGFIDVHVDDITSSVFPAFCSFLRTQGFKFKLLAIAFGLLQRLGAKFIIITGTHP